MADTIGDKIEKKVDEAIKDAPKDIKEKVEQNAFGYVCTKALASEENQNRCKALTRLWDIASSGAKAATSCAATVGVGAAEVGTDGLATPVAAPVGAATAASCAYNGAKTLDSAQAMVRQIYSGKEVKTFEEEGEETIGTWIEEKVKEEVDRQIREAESSDFRHFQQLNPGATAEDYNQLQQAEDDFDAGQF